MKFALNITNWQALAPDLAMCSNGKHGRASRGRLTLRAVGKIK